MREQVIFGMLRIKNEARWIERVIKSIQPICAQIFVLDDHSDDDTVAICRRLGCHVFPSEFDGMDESRDKDFLLSKVFDAVPQQDRHFTFGNFESPYWALAIDGDEELVIEDQDVIRQTIKNPGVHAYRLRILYLWDRLNQIRVDRVYRTFDRPSMFRLMNTVFRFQQTPFGVNVYGRSINLHCSSIPQEMLHHARPCAARLLHWGFLNREDRLRKFRFYNVVDRDNEAEDCYVHTIQGDVPELPPSMKLKHAGPMEFETVSFPQLDEVMV